MTMLLKSFDANASPPAVLDVLRRDGGVIVRDLAPVNLIDACAAELRSSFNEFDESQRTDFSGSKTLRCGGVLRYAPSCAELIAHQMVLNVADAILLPSCADYQIGSTTGIEILPGGVRPATSSRRHTLSDSDRRARTSDRCDVVF